MNSRQREVLERLKAVTAGLGENRLDFSFLGARIAGNTLDNQNGESVRESSLRLGTQEIIVFLSRFDQNDQVLFEAFNLADLIELARRASHEERIQGEENKENNHAAPQSSQDQEGTGSGTG